MEDNRPRWAERVDAMLALKDAVARCDEALGRCRETRAFADDDRDATASIARHISGMRLQMTYSAQVLGIRSTEL